MLSTYDYVAYVGRLSTLTTFDKTDSSTDMFYVNFKNSKNLIFVSHLNESYIASVTYFTVMPEGEKH